MKLAQAFENIRGTCQVSLTTFLLDVFGVEAIFRLPTHE